jgi:uncharacterized protein YcbK (DUF882 family)
MLRRASVLVVLAGFLASCTNAVTDPDLQAGMPGYNATSSMSGDDVQAQVIANTGVAVDDEQTTGATAPIADGSGATGELPQQVVALPTSNPAIDMPAQPSPAATMTSIAEGTGVQAAAQPPVSEGDAAAAGVNPQQTAAVDPATAGDGSVLTAAAPIEEPTKPKSMFAAFFSGGAKSAGSSSHDRDGAVPTTGQVAKAAPKPAVMQASAKAETAEIDFAAFEQPTKRAAASSGGEDALPGVRQTALFEIKRRSGLDDDADVDIYEEEDHGPIQMASAAGMARLAPNGLQVQTESVDVACLKPSLVRVLKQMERHYGKKMVVTSGYRNPQRNRRARGAKNSLHMYCAAADVQIPGVGKWELASYARTMSGRGGIGTYCHTNSVHVDVGPERDWNWRCRGRRR